ncbi:hypothetical protein ACFPRL_26555 [Pseudoclavibacter helvolus]
MPKSHRPPPPSRVPRLLRQQLTTPLASNGTSTDPSCPSFLLLRLLGGNPSGTTRLATTRPLLRSSTSPRRSPDDQ